jgi:hypothetical protein
MKANTVSSLKKKVWTAFSLHIRKKYADWRGYETCVTCGKKDHYKNLQAGHFIQGRHNQVLFDERNVHPQCVKCNVFKSGNLVEYYGFMLKTYGQDVIDELRKLDKKNKQFTIKELEKLLKKYKP